MVVICALTHSITHSLTHLLGFNIIINYFLCVFLVKISNNFCKEVRYFYVSVLLFLNGTHTDDLLSSAEISQIYRNDTYVFLNSVT